MFSQVKIGRYVLKNRVVMAPLTRCRSPGGVPTLAVAEHYAARASAGLIVSEATLVSEVGRGFPNTPSIITDEQVAAWAAVTSAVHAAGGLIFCQLWHCGRTASSALNGGVPAVGPSAIAVAGGAVPRALALEELPAIVEEYRNGAAQALAAGFDGVEVHGANGYLLDEFLQTCSNTRTDAYGGTAENRARLLVEVVKACVSVWGADRVGVRLSPASTFNDMRDDDPASTFTAAASALDRVGGLAYLHIVEPRVDGNTTRGAENPPPAATAGLDAAFFRKSFRGPLLAAGGLTQALADAGLAAGSFDAAVFGRLFVANADLVFRFRAGPDTPLNVPDRATFYSGGAPGYNDYARLFAADGTRL